MTDTHAGKNIGLLNSETELVRANDDGSIHKWKPEMTTTQKWLWSVYEGAIGHLVEWAAGDEILVCHNGDVTNGDRYDSNIPDTTREDQRVIAYGNLLPLLDLPNVRKVRLMTGTAVHVPECAEARVAHRLAEKTGKDVNCVHHARFDMGADVIEVAHHGPYPGSRDWLHGNVAYLHLKDRVARDRRAGKQPSRVYVYGHFHRLARARLDDRWQQESHSSDLVVVPALCGLDGFARKVGKSPPILESGLVALEFQGGCLTEIRELVEEIDLRTEEKL